MAGTSSEEMVARIDDVLGNLAPAHHANEWQVAIDSAQTAADVVDASPHVMGDVAVSQGEPDWRPFAVWAWAELAPPDADRSTLPDWFDEFTTTGELARRVGLEVGSVRETLTRGPYYNAGALWDQLDIDAVIRRRSARPMTFVGIDEPTSDEDMLAIRQSMARAEEEWNESAPRVTSVVDGSSVSVAWADEPQLTLTDRGRHWLEELWAAYDDLRPAEDEIADALMRLGSALQEAEISEATDALMRFGSAIADREDTEGLPTVNRAGRRRNRDRPGHVSPHGPPPRRGSYR